MAGRYLLVARTDGVLGDLPPERLASGLYPVFANPNLRLFVSSDQPWQNRLESSGGIVGNIHPRSPTNADLPFGTANLGQAFDERCLLSCFWGDYLSFWGDGARFVCMRDPSGTLPCFFANSGSTLYLASDVTTLLQACAMRPVIDWDQLTRLLYVNDLPEARTSLDGIQELLPGHRLVFAGTRTHTEPVWSPWDHVARDNGPSPAQLAKCVRDCVTTIAAPYQSLLIGVSGGLDSSILTSCLAHRGSDIRPVTISTDDAHGDEAIFARVLCDQLGLTLTPEAYQLDAVDITWSSVAHLPRPGGRAQLQAYDAAVFRAARSTGATAFLSGVGGDNVFYYTNSARPLVDHYLDHGLGPHLLKTLWNTCRLTGCSLREAICEARAVPRGSEPRKYRWRVDTRFLDADRVAMLSREPLVHPWLEGPATSRPGRAAHIAMILRAQRYLDGQDRTWPVRFLQPLMAQPIIELCLAIPSWRMIEGGRDRAVARAAFADVLPPAIRGRRVKGGPDGFAHQIIRNHLPEIRERLLDGALAGHRILDRPALETALHEEHLMGGIDYVRILLLLDAEAWARHWIACGDGPVARPTA